MRARNRPRASRPRLTARFSRSSNNCKLRKTRPKGPARPSTTAKSMTKRPTEDTLLIGLVSISDRASAGVYEDQGLPALRDWSGAAFSSPWEREPRLIPDERPAIEAALIELVD